MPKRNVDWKKKPTKWQWMRNKCKGLTDIVQSKKNVRMHHQNPIPFNDHHHELWHLIGHGVLEKRRRWAGMQQRRCQTTPNVRSTAQEQFVDSSNSQSVTPQHFRSLGKTAPSLPALLYYWNHIFLETRGQGLCEIYQVWEGHDLPLCLNPICEARLKILY